MSASNIRAGRAFIEIGATDINLKKTLNTSIAGVKQFGQAVTAIGAKLGALGLGVLGPLGAASKSFSSFEDALAALKSTVNPTAAELMKIEKAISDISKSTGVGPTKVTEAMLELLRAGRPLADVLGGTTEAALKFARVAGVSAADAATTLADAMKVFDVDAKTASDTMSAAADASSVSLEQIVQAFAQVSAVAKLTGLSIEETAAALGLLGSAGVKGSDAGTSLKTFLLRLMAPAEEVKEEFAGLFKELRQGDGTLKPLAGMIDVLNARLGGLGQEAKDAALAKIFGTDAIRAGAILLGEGTKGLADFRGKMKDSLSTQQKYAMLLDTVSGGIERLKAGMERLGITVGGALAPALNQVTTFLGDFVGALNTAAAANPGFIVDVAKAAAELVGVGLALTAAGEAAGAIAATIGFLVTPLGLVTAALVAGGAAYAMYTQQGQKALADLGPAVSSMKDTVVAAFAGIADALKAGDLALAGQIFWSGLKVEWLKGVDYLQGVWSGFTLFIKDAYESLGFDLQRIFLGIKNDAAEALQLALGASGGGETGAQRAKRRQGQRQELANVDLAQAGQQDANRAIAASDPGIAKRRAELEAAQDDLGRLLAQANPTVTDVGTGAGASGGDRAAPGTPEAAKDVEKGVNAAAKKVDIAGSFSAQAIGGLTAGESVSTKLQKQLDEAKKQGKTLDRIDDKLRGAKMVFT